MKDIMKNIKNHSEWRTRMNVPGYIRVLPDEEALLKKGPIYFSGVDKKFRPIIVINTQKVYELNVRRLISETFEGSGGTADSVCGGWDNREVLSRREGRELDYFGGF